MFHGMKLYTVHTKPGSDYTLDKPIFLREGFNWLAFLFTFLWALAHRLWAFALVLFIANITIAMAMRYGVFSQLTGGIVQFGVQVLAGFHANDALRNVMQKRQYLFQDITSGESLLMAEQRYFDRLIASQPKIPAA